MHKRITAPLVVALLAGCAVKVTEPVAVVVQQPIPVSLSDAQVAKVAEQHAADPLGAPAGAFGLPVRRIAEQLHASLSQRGIRTLTLAISPFVDLDQPTLHRDVGEQLAEGFYHELQARGYNLIDHRALPFGDADPANLTPKLAEFYRQHRISYVLSGTFSSHPDGVTVNARMLDTVTRQVVATGRSQVGLAALEGGLPGYDPLGSRGGMIIENAGVPLP